MPGHSARMRYFFPLWMSLITVPWCRWCSCALQLHEAYCLSLRHAPCSPSWPSDSSSFPTSFLSLTSLPGLSPQPASPADHRPAQYLYIFFRQLAPERLQWRRRCNLPVSQSVSRLPDTDTSGLVWSTRLVGGLARIMAPFPGGNSSSSRPGRVRHWIVLMLL